LAARKAIAVARPGLPVKCKNEPSLIAEADLVIARNKPAQAEHDRKEKIQWDAQ
jgi:hypothetical protein